MSEQGGMSEQKDLAARFIDLESHIAHHESMIHDLSDMIHRQWEMIDGVLKKLDRLEARLRANDEPHDVSEEPPPPHY